MRKNEISNWYKNKHKDQKIPQYELERKWRAYLYEEEQLQLALKGIPSPGTSQQPEETSDKRILTENGQFIITENGDFLSVES